MRNLMSACLAGSMLLVAACGPVESTSSTAEGGQALFSKDLVATDQAEANVVFVTVRASDVEALDAYTAETFEVIPTYADALDAPAPAPTEADLAELEPADPERFVEIEVTHSDLAPGVVGYRLVEHHGPEFHAAFTWRYYYGTDDCVDVTRTSFWHRVWAKIWYKANSGSGWSTLVGEKKLSNNETLSRCQNGSYKLKAGVKARKTSHFEVQFWE